MFKKIWICCCIIIMVLLFAQGTKRICSAYDFWKKAGDDFVTQQNGGDTETYNQIVSLTTTGQQISGSIMALVGGIGFIVFSRELINEFPNSPKNNFRL